MDCAWRCNRGWEARVAWKEPGTREKPGRNQGEQRESMTALFFLEHVLEVVIEKRLMFRVYPRQPEDVVYG